MTRAARLPPNIVSRVCLALSFSRQTDTCSQRMSDLRTARALNATLTLSRLSRTRNNAEFFGDPRVKRILFLCAFALSGCAHVGVQPWERDVLARPEMSLDA